MGALIAYYSLSPKPIDGFKTITVVINHIIGEDKTIEIKTDSNYLRDAMEQSGLISGIEGQYGLYVTIVDGEEADESKQQWWGYTKSGQYVETAIDKTIIEDGDIFEFTLNEGW